MRCIVNKSRLQQMGGLNLPHRRDGGGYGYEGIRVQARHTTRQLRNAATELRSAPQRASRSDDAKTDQTACLKATVDRPFGVARSPGSRLRQCVSGFADPADGVNQRLTSAGPRHSFVRGSRTRPRPQPPRICSRVIPCASEGTEETEAGGGAEGGLNVVTETGGFRIGAPAANT